MQIKLFTVPIHDDGTLGAELNRFLRGHRVLEVHHELVQAQGGACWCFCIRYLEGSAPATGSRKPRKKVDYKEVLDEPTFQKFALLRSRRKAIAEADGIPAYAVCTDEQLADIARLEPLTREGMRSVKGIGTGKVERYGERLLQAEPEKEDGDTP